MKNGGRNFVTWSRVFISRYIVSVDTVQQIHSDPLNPTMANITDYVRCFSCHCGGFPFPFILATIAFFTTIGS